MSDSRHFIACDFRETRDSAAPGETRTRIRRVQGMIENSSRFVVLLLGMALTSVVSLLLAGVLSISALWSGAPMAMNAWLVTLLPAVASVPVIAIAIKVICFLTEQRDQLRIEIERKTIAENRFSRLANTDELTGLGNRRSFVERAREAMALSRRHAQPLALLFVDVDGLKELNDNEGHARGDLALKQLARALRQCLRQSDYAARYGGDEFVILMPQTDMHAATIAAERLRAAIETGNDGLPLTVSVGLASTQGTHVGIEELVARADEALYVAKRAGRNQVCTTFPDGNRHLVTRHGSMELRARSA
ncbi:MAG: GGDEF domain-containing protein [Geminicoccaceae bacterium]|nr:GGDEF domain-containing protein [Geminicoccaceae bacterium]